MKDDSEVLVWSFRLCNLSFSSGGVVCDWWMFETKSPESSHCSWGNGFYVKALINWYLKFHGLRKASFWLNCLRKGHADGMTKLTAAFRLAKRFCALTVIAEYQSLLQLVGRWDVSFARIPFLRYLKIKMSGVRENRFVFRTHAMDCKPLHCSSRCFEGYIRAWCASLNSSKPGAPSSWAFWKSVPFWVLSLQLWRRYAPHPPWTISTFCPGLIF